MITNEMIDAGARALYAESFRQGSGGATLKPDELAAEDMTQAIIDGTFDVTKLARACIEAALPALLTPSAAVIDAGESVLDDHTESGWSSDADGNRHDYTEIVSGAARAMFVAMVRKWAEENGVKLPEAAP